MLVSSDDQVKAYIKKIMSQLDKWMLGGKISKLVVVITSKDTGEHVERWQFDVSTYPFLLISHPTSQRTHFFLLPPPGPDIFPPLQKILQILFLVFQTHRQRKRRSLFNIDLRPSSSRENRSRNPIRDSVHLPTDNCLGYFPATTRRRLYVQCAGVCGCR